ncbi:hypothetical protein GOFOIKOB_2324 [Methylobacterium tardum]|jgi:hypothetical protein|uniref:hypothetical protein n=1 Tax=Methylobacterium tardum TaxID=374432 RepID=UPI001EE0ABD3|nr:hypothetical protein [Methylobacterium tardum]URD38514.1 hypothetical protein M6G65_08825 [Methylobacterium tardum]GJE49288.1 hypothetical protein GOFOIKOB_2324 [Methylobacterium tardum]
MSIAILIAFIAGALCLGVLSSIVPLRRREEDELGESLSFEDEFFDVGGPVIDLEPNR